MWWPRRRRRQQVESTVLHHAPGPAARRAGRAAGVVHVAALAADREWTAHGGTARNLRRHPEHSPGSAVPGVARSLRPRRRSRRSGRRSCDPDASGATLARSGPVPGTRERRSCKHVGAPLRSWSNQRPTASTRRRSLGRAGQPRTRRTTGGRPPHQALRTKVHRRHRRHRWHRSPAPSPQVRTQPGQTRWWLPSRRRGRRPPTCRCSPSTCRRRGPSQPTA